MQTPPRAPRHAAVEGGVAGEVTQRGMLSKAIVRLPMPLAHWRLTAVAWGAARVGRQRWCPPKPTVELTLRGAPRHAGVEGGGAHPPAGTRWIFSGRTETGQRRRVRDQQGSTLNPMTAIVVNMVLTSLGHHQKTITAIKETTLAFSPSIRARTETKIYTEQATTRERTTPHQTGVRKATATVAANQMTVTREMGCINESTGRSKTTRTICSKMSPPKWPPEI